MTAADAGLSGSFCCIFSALGKCKIILTCSFGIMSWQFKSIRLMKTVNDYLQFFPCFIQQGNILCNVYLPVHMRHQVYLSINTLTEKNQCTCVKRRFFPVTRKAYKILQIWIFCDLFHQFSVGVLKFCLYD